MHTFVTPKQLAEEIGISSAAMYGWIRSGKVKVSKTLSNRYRISLEEAKRVKEACENESP